MQLPFFYEREIKESDKQFFLSEHTSKHCAQVLRMREGDKVQLVNGAGLVAVVEIKAVSRRNTLVAVQEVVQHHSPGRQIHIAISLLKNTGRFEWFLEKSAEIGVQSVFPLICKHTEKLQFKKERLDNILVSAMLQSRQAFRVQLADPVNFDEFILNCKIQNKFIAHCEKSAKKLLYEFCPVQDSAIMLIGPEGDFSSQEIETALKANYQPVSLGNTRLRTETAGIYSAVLLSL